MASLEHSSYAHTPARVIELEHKALYSRKPPGNMKDMSTSAKHRGQHQNTPNIATTHLPTKKPTLTPSSKKQHSPTCVSWLCELLNRLGTQSKQHILAQNKSAIDLRPHANRETCLPQPTSRLFYSLQMCCTGECCLVEHNVKQCTSGALHRLRRSKLDSTNEI